MGHQISDKKITRQAKFTFIRQLLEDVEALEYMIAENLFEANTWRIGAEQELCIVNNEWKPAPDALKILEQLNNPYITTELAKYNLEINLDPLHLKSGCFYEVEKQLEEKINLISEVCKPCNDKIILAGILPTITRNELTLDYLTPLKRYTFLNNALLKARGLNFDLFLKGLDEIHLRHDNILFEACNTSFQCHLQLHPSDFAVGYNWAQAIAAPVLAAASNSPLLLGKELWSEIRIALFQQSIDTRNTIDEMREKKSRVTFGDRWVSSSIIEIYKENIAFFHPLLIVEHDEYSMQKIKSGEIPNLYSLRLHNGTVYSWNRLCYGISDNKPHLRLENRYIPAGPTIMDEVANMAFWTGLMVNPPAEAFDIANHFEFKDVKSNFFKAARAGIESVFIWKEKEIHAKKLIEQELLPIALKGLQKTGIADSEIMHYLGVIEKRMQTNTGAQWQVKNYRKLRKVMSQSDAVTSLTENMYLRQQKNVPVCDWPEISIEKCLTDQHNKMRYVRQLMSTKLITVFPDDSLGFINNIMQWHKIGHMLIEDRKGKLVGLVTASEIVRSIEKYCDISQVPVQRVMKKEIITTEPEAEIETALQLMKQHNITSLPVVFNQMLVGIVTRNDMLRWLALKASSVD
ncbi:MAG: HPP family protein [Chitinophagales bacterium]